MRETYAFAKQDLFATKILSRTTSVPKRMDTCPSLQDEEEVRVFTAQGQKRAPHGRLSSGRTGPECKFALTLVDEPDRFDGCARDASGSKF